MCSFFTFFSKFEIPQSFSIVHLSIYCEPNLGALFVCKCVYDINIFTFHIIKQHYSFIHLSSSAVINLVYMVLFIYYALNVIKSFIRLKESISTTLQVYILEASVSRETPKEDKILWTVLCSKLTMFE